MHDPMTVAWSIKSPLKIKSKCFPEGYRNTLITIWHVDPCRDGSDDSCGWFQRARHGDQAVLEKIVKAFEFDWDRTFTCSDDDESDSPSRTYNCGFFAPEGDGAGMPNMSVSAIVLNLFFLAANEYFKCDGGSNWKKSRAFMRRNLYDILILAENPCDSLRDSITRKFGCDTKRDERIRQMAETIYGWILRNEQKWWRHPRFHFHHFKIQIHFLGSLKRFLFSRCAGCKKRFKWGYSPCTNQWDSSGPLWFRSEEGVYHSECHAHHSALISKNEPTN